MSNTHQGGGYGARKIAIPRLPRTAGSQSSPKERQRVARACTACRAHKIKCSGDSPRCKHCESTGRECVYIMPRKDRLKIISERCVQMATYLRALRGWASEEDNVRIGELLDAMDEDAPELPLGNTPSAPDTDGENSRAASRMSLFDESTVESDEQVDVSSLDLLDENLHETDRSRATGFVGKNSEVQWLRSLFYSEKAEEDSSNMAGSTAKRKISTEQPASNEQVSSVTFYLDSEDIDPGFYVEPHDLPTPETAERLLGVYMDKVHDSFPILSRRLFEDQFRKYFTGLRHGSASTLNSKWQAILNLVFAIGARYSHLCKAEWRSNEKDHLVYQARARSLAWRETILVQHPDLPQIQVGGMLAFYFLSIGQVNRAWIVVGMALRYAQALGLHVRNEDPSASPPKREVLVRIWWSLYSLERQLSVITGRPSVVVDSSCSVPLPLPIPEDQFTEEAAARRSSSTSTATGYLDSPATPTGFGKSDPNPGSYIKAVAQMGIITQSILNGLYSAGIMIRSSAEIQHNIIQLGKRLDNWASTLPQEFNPRLKFSEGHHPQEFFRERMLLGHLFYSGRILLTRLCIGGLGHAVRDRKDAGFMHQMAMVCVDAARSQLDLLPDDPDPLFLIENGPFWSIVHYFMQALSVILLALSHSSLGPEEHVILSNYAKKTIRWLRSLDDPLAERACRVAFSSFELVANRLSLDISDLWSGYIPVFPGAMSNIVNDGINSDPYSIPNSAGIFDTSSNLLDPALSFPIPSNSDLSFQINPMDGSPVVYSLQGRPGYENPFPPQS